MKKILRTILVITLLCLIACLAYMQMQHTLKIDKPAKTIYDLSYIDSHNKRFKLNDLKGKIAVINFWATYCGPCREEMPDLSDISKSYRDKGIVILGVAADEMSHVQEFLDQTKVSYTNVVAEYDAIDLSRRLGNTTGVLPFTVILDGKGLILHSHAGRINPAKISSVIDHALRRDQ